MKGDGFTAAGDDRAATAFYQLALANAPPRAEQTPDLRVRLARAAGAVQAAGARFSAHLEAQLGAAGVAPKEAGARFVEALAILNGSKAVYSQQPTSFYYPRLPLIEFYDPAAFDWVAALAAAVPAMQAELAAVLADNAGLQPYVAASPNRPNRGHALLDDPEWNAFYLWQDGAPAPAARQHCSATLAALDAAPLPRIAGRSPMALFSVLRPHTHIPPHNGMLNTRLICHTPLIVPDGCRLRVGNEFRRVEPGRAMIFDDSIEHEAWNDSDDTRVVLLFEIWRPELDAAERTALTVLFEAIGEYPGA
jgi:aspartyl/asparaginyl beta-hydroxylase (cupin superfamily)